MDNKFMSLDIQLFAEEDNVVTTTETVEKEGKDNTQESSSKGKTYTRDELNKIVNAKREKIKAELTKEDMGKIQSLNEKNSLFFNHQDPKMVEWFDKMIQVRRENNDFQKEKKNW